MTPLEWLKKLAAQHNKTNLLHAPQFEASRLLLFSSSKTTLIPDEDLGEHAKTFMRIAPEFYANGDWSSPLSITKIIDIYRAFSEINKDLINDTDWKPFWENYIKEVSKQKSSDAEMTRLRSLVESAQSQLLTGYRFRVISATHFLQSIQNESKAERSLREIRCRSFFQQINRYHRELSAEECYYRLMDIFEKSLINEIEAVQSTFEIQLNGSKKIEQGISFLEQSILKIKSKFEFEFLGEKALFILKPLEDTLLECQAIKTLIDEALQNMYRGATPGIDARILIDLEMPTIEASSVYQNLSETGARFIAKYLTSSGVFKNAFEKILETRFQATIVYFSDPFPFWRVQDNLDRVTSPSRKRALIELLYSEFQSDKVNFPDPPFYLKWLGIKLTLRQKQFSKMLQKHFLAALKREYKEISQSLALERFRESISKPVLAPLGKASFWGAVDDSAQNELKDFMENPPEHKLPLAETAFNLFDPLTPMGIDLIFGLLNQLTPVLKFASSKISIASVHQTFEKSLDFSKLIEGEIDALTLSKALRQIVDLEQRKKTIMQLFEYAISHPGVQSADCVPILQELYINALKEEIRRVDPKNIDEKNAAYQTLLAPAKASALLRYGDERVTNSLHNKLDALMERISV